MELTAFYTPKTLDTTQKIAVSGEYVFTKKRKQIWHNDEKIFYKNNDRNREKPTSVIKRIENYEFYALIRVADEFEDGTKPI